MTAVNLCGVLTGGRLFALPAVVFVLLVGAVVVIGLLRGEPLAPLPPPSQVELTASVGALLVLAAFANGCVALTGVEAIANATPSFRKPRAVRARHAEAGLGLVLGSLLIGLAVLIEVFDVRPADGRTLLSLLAEGAGAAYLAVQLSTVLLLGLAANTSYGGLPVLIARLARDGALPHVLGLRADRQVYRQGPAALRAVRDPATGLGRPGDGAGSAVRDRRVHRCRWAATFSRCTWCPPMRPATAAISPSAGSPGARRYRWCSSSRHSTPSDRRSPGSCVSSVPPTSWCSSVRWPRHTGGSGCCSTVAGE
ncbi:MAG: amino acid permease [Pseudonocardiaceae bacterium]